MPTKFTDVYIKNLPAKVARYDLREGAGFGIRVFPSGEKSWFYIYHHHGRKRRMTLGSYPAMGLKDARQAHAEAARLLAQGIDPAEDKIEKRQAAIVAAEIERKNPTVQTLVHEYLEHWAKPHKRSWVQDARILYKDVLPTWRNRKARDIDRRDLVLVLDAIKARGAPILANRTLAVVRRMFNFAVERGILDTSPAGHIKAPGKENRRDRVLTREEIRIVWHGLDDAPVSDHTRLALRLILVTGQRKGEVLAMEWPEVDINSGWWTIPAGKSKNGLLHRVPLSSMATEIVDELRTMSTSPRWVFPSPRVMSDQPMTGAAVDHALRRCSFEGVGHFTPHDLRRTVGTSLGELGFNRLVQDKVLNHKDNTVGGIYDRHSYDKEKRLALDAWAEHLRGIVTGEVKPSNVVTIPNR